MRSSRSALLFPFAFLLFTGCGPKPEAEPAWVGLVAALDGPSGAGLRQGADLAVGDAANVRIEGRAPAVIAVNDNASDEAAEAEAVRLLSVNRVAALIGGPDAGRSLRLARAARPYAAPVILPCEAAGPLPGDAVFTLGVRPGWRGQVLARYAAGQKTKHAVVIVDERQPVAAEVADAFTAEWARAGGAAAERYPYQSEADLPGRVDQAAGAKPDVVLIAAAAPDFEQARTRLGSNLPNAALLYGGPDMGTGPSVAEDGNVIAATVFTPGGLTDNGKEVAAKYQERFHEAPDLLAVEGYEAAHVLFDAMARAKTVAADKVREQLAAAEFDGLTGPLRFKDGRARRRVFVVALHGGEAKPVQTIDPEPDAPASGGK